MNLSRIAIGTAQFGFNYGINNTSGKPSIQEIESILDFALTQGINTLDTAIAYGDSETVLGKVGVDNFEIYTKLPSIKTVKEKNIESWVVENVENSLARLKKDSLSGLLLHRPLELFCRKGQNTFKTIEKLKEQKLVNSIGVSVYSPEELSLVIENYKPDLVQLPLNIIDSRWDELLVKLKNNNIEVHVRSVFLQGLLLMEPSKRKLLFSRWSILWDNYEYWLSVIRLEPIQACIGGIFHNNSVSKLVFGTENVTQLREIVGIAKDINKVEVPSNIRSNDITLLNPSNWNLK